MKRLLMGALLLSNSIFCNQNMPEPYCSIVCLPFDSHNWFDSSNRTKLESLIKEHHPRLIVELGSWLGASAICMAAAMPEDGKLIAIDDWTADSDQSIQKDVEGGELKRRLPTLYQQFLSNVINKKLAHKIVPMRMKVLEAAQALNVKADMIYVDASHDTESVYKDIIAWYPKLAPGGIMCGDDWPASSVRAGVMRAAHELGIQVDSYGACWFFPAKK